MTLTDTAAEVTQAIRADVAITLLFADTPPPGKSLESRRLASSVLELLALRYGFQAAAMASFEKAEHKLRQYPARPPLRHLEGVAAPSPHRLVQSYWLSYVGSEIRAYGFEPESVRGQRRIVGPSARWRNDLLPLLNIQATLLDYQEGSLFTRFQLDIGPTDARHFFSGVAASLLVAALLGLASPSGSDNTARVKVADQDWFVCSVGLVVRGDPAAILERATDELAMPAEAEPQRRERVIKARQLCLRAAGFDPGPIDGVEGPATRAAAANFASYHGLARISWDSYFVRRFVMEVAHHRQIDRARSLGAESEGAGSPETTASRQRP